MWLYFNAFDQSGSNHPFDYNNPPQIIIVDNSPPTGLSFSYDQTSTKIDVYNWEAFDSQSQQYTYYNDTSGLNGIASYGIVVKDTNGNVKGNVSIKATDYNNHTFSGLTANTNYKVSVTANDLAGNSSTLEKSVTTAPPAPTVSVSDTNFCNITLSWTTSAGAVSYNLYEVKQPSDSIIANTSGTSYTVTGLQSNSNYKFYVRALNSTNVKSDESNTVSVSTLTVPTPDIIGPSLICTSGGTFQASNLPTDCSVIWDEGPGLSESSSSGNSVNVSASGNNVSWIKATFDAGCGTASDTNLVVVGSPKPGSIRIQFDAPPGRFTATITPVPSATSYNWYLDGVLKSGWNGISAIFPRVRINNCGITYAVDVSMVNQCGVSATSHTQVYEQPCYNSFVLYPNPASSSITISPNQSLSLESSTVQTIDSVQKKNTMIKSVKIIDNFGTVYMRRKFANNTKKANINVSGLKKGNYILIINEETKPESYNFIIN